MAVESITTDLVPFSSRWFINALMNGSLSTIVVYVIYRFFRR